MPILRKTATTTSNVQRDPIPGVETEKPAPGKKATPATDPFAKKYNQTEAGKGGFKAPEPGAYNARITGAEAVIDGQKEYAYFEYTIVEPNDKMKGKTCRQYFNFTNEDGSEGTGLPYFKSNMAMLGHEEELKSWTHMEEVLAEIVNEDIGVIIDVKKKGQYTNIYLNEVPEDQSSVPSL